MKAAYLRSVDRLGRIVLPKEVRKELKYVEEQLLEISIEGEQIVLTKACSCCALCGSSENLLNRGKYVICSNCLKEIEQTS